MLTEKYVAGFLDSDGCIAIKWKAPTQKPLLEISFSQKQDQDGVLHQLEEQFGGRMRTKTVSDRAYSELILRGKPAHKLLNRVAKHLVSKRYFALWCQERAQHPTGDVKEARKELEEARRQRSLPLPNFPPRKWLAGYLDGDGCLYAKRQHNGSRKATQLYLSVAAGCYMTEGIEVIQKVYGGTIKAANPAKGKYELRLGLPPSKAEKVLGHCAKHMAIKRDQADFVLGCARMGHYRDGETIQAGLKHLKTHPHRLNDPGADVSALLDQVRDIRWVSKAGCGTQCAVCGADEVPHYKNGLCETCYQGQSA